MRTSVWMRTGLVAAGLTFVLCNAGTVSAQSLGDVARQESERRSQQAQSGKTYTNEDLDAVESSATPPPAAPAAVAAPPTTTTNSNGVVMQETGKGTININAPEAKNNRDENYWRKRSRDMRENLARVRANIAAAQQRIAALEQAAPTPANARERQAAETALKQLRTEESMRNTDMAQLKTFAAGQKVPPEWLQFD